MAAKIEAPHLDQILPDDGITLRKPDISPILMRLAQGIVRLTGWRLYGQFPDYEKAVIIAAPHTSNWDGFLMLLTAWSFGIKPIWMVKAEVTRSIIGGLVRWLGGMGIDRRASHDTVQQAVTQMKAAKRMMLVVAPEGTRRKTSHWKAGFYWIADSAQVPIISAFVDYTHRRLGIGPSFMPTGDIQADLDPIFEYYGYLTGLHPEKMSDRKIRPTQQHGHDSGHDD
ncbi:MAG TPA: 1-acyl-sn-glycerol-3-phosphate acyltransferase [Phototrophicaceae bacterium]|jgi:1-acyl-sn-glycerol-3-phosphate acyltransferase|nr:1-acyl-sn-glycerol-3-phosphate acyltransferase [Phototrophicaceae bacterium]